MADNLLSRRAFIKGAMAVSAAAALGAGALAGFLPAISGGPPAAPSPIVQRSASGKTTPVRLAQLDGPAVAHVIGEWEYRPTVLYKLPVAELRASSRVRGYNTGQFALQHPGEADMAVLAYDDKCTHLGCTVGFNSTLGASKDVPDYDGDGLPGRALCPCHSAQYDIFDLAKHTPGTPAPRPLDALAIRWGPELDGSATIEVTRRFYQATPRAADQQGMGAPFRLAG